MFVVDAWLSSTARGSVKLLTGLNIRRIVMRMSKLIEGTNEKTANSEIKLQDKQFIINNKLFVTDESNKIERSLLCCVHNIYCHQITTNGRVLTLEVV